jgi:hypothetical protein
VKGFVCNWTPKSGNNQELQFHQGIVVHLKMVALGS